MRETRLGVADAAPNGGSKTPDSTARRPLPIPADIASREGTVFLDWLRIDSWAHGSERYPVEPHELQLVRDPEFL